MNEVWNLDVIYRGFDDPAFAADMEKLEKLVQDYVAFAGELDKQTPLDGLKKGVALEESLSELSGKLVEYAFLRQSGNTRDAEAGFRLGQVMQILTGAAGAQAQWREWVSKIPDLMTLVGSDETLKDYTFLFESLLRNSSHLLGSLGEQISAKLSMSGSSAWSDLQEYLTMLEEAEKRDHRKLGREMDLFHFEPEYAPGAVFWHDKGYKIYRKLIEYMRNRQEHNGYIEISTPRVMDRVLWEISGHWDKYGAHNYSGQTEDKKWFCIKPMNCPGGLLVYKQGIKSYRDLPLRVAEFGKVNRYEASGSLMGLMRVREFTQDDAHIFCTPEQMEEECITTLKLILDIYKDFGFEDVKIYLSTRPDSIYRIGSDEIWDLCENALANALTSHGYKFEINEGEGAFYGPKLEFILKDAIGREWQCGTIQVDMNLPQRFDISYIGEDGEKHQPVMLHRALFGSIERFLGILIENHAGKLPLWLSPEQVVVAPIVNDFDGYAEEVADRLRKAGLYAKTDLRNEKINYKIREHSVAKIPVIAVVGAKEKENGTVTVRRLGSDKQEVMKLNDFVNALREEAQMPHLHE